MGLLDSLTGQAEDIAGKVGISQDQILSLVSAFESKVGDGSTHLEALQAAASEHGLSLDTIQQLLTHSGAGGDLLAQLGGLAGGAGGGDGGLVGKLAGLAGGLFNKG